MLKITLTVQEKKDKSGNCTVKIKVPDKLDKASIPEKQCGAMVYNAIDLALQNMNKESEIKDYGK